MRAVSARPGAPAMARRYFANLDTGGHMIMDAKMGSTKDERLLSILASTGYEEVTRERYEQLMQSQQIGERAAMRLRSMGCQRHT